MGSRMAQRLMNAGHRVVGYNRTRSKAEWLLELGMQWAETPAAVAQAADIVLSMVAHTAALQAIAGGADGILAGLRPGSVFVDMSTVSPAVSRGLAAQVAALGAQMLDAPVSGSVITLEEGRLSLMVGGDRHAYDRIVPILSGPPATLGVPIPVELPRPRSVAQLAHDEQATHVRAHVVATLTAAPGRHRKQDGPNEPGPAVLHAMAKETQ